MHRNVHAKINFNLACKSKLIFFSPQNSHYTEAYMPMPHRMPAKHSMPMPHKMPMPHSMPMPCIMPIAYAT